MKFIKLAILFISTFVFAEGTDIGQTNFDSTYTGLKSNLIVDMQPKSCEFQWWSGSKNYSGLLNNYGSQQNVTTQQ